MSAFHLLYLWKCGIIIIIGVSTAAAHSRRPVCWWRLDLLLLRSPEGSTDPHRGPNKVTSWTAFSLDCSPSTSTRLPFSATTIRPGERSPAASSLGLQVVLVAFASVRHCISTRTTAASECRCWQCHCDRLSQTVGPRRASDLLSLLWNRHRNRHPDTESVAFCS